MRSSKGERGKQLGGKIWGGLEKGDHLARAVSGKRSFRKGPRDYEQERRTFRWPSSAGDSRLVRKESDPGNFLIKVPETKRACPKGQQGRCRREIGRNFIRKSKRIKVARKSGAGKVDWFEKEQKFLTNGGAEEGRKRGRRKANYQ